MNVQEMLTDKQAVIFDLDGTLLDSMSLWHDVDVEFLGERGMDVPADLMKSISGMPFHEVAVYFKKRFLLPESIEQIMQIWNDMVFQKYSTVIPLKPGVQKFLTYLKGRGYLLGIATSNSRSLLLAALEANDLQSFFDVMITADETLKGKPAPDVYLTAASALGVSPDHCLVFEDIPLGIQAGKNAGMTVCAVWDAYSDDEREQKIALADFYIDSMKDLELMNE